MKKQILLSTLAIFLSVNAIYGQLEPCDDWIWYEYVNGSDAHLWATNNGSGVYYVNSEGGFFRWGESDSDVTWDVNCDIHPCKELLDAVSGGKRPKRPPYAVTIPPVKQKKSALTQLMKDIAEGKYRTAPKGDQAQACAKSRAAARSIIKRLKK